MDSKVLEARRALYEQKMTLPDTVKWSDQQGCYVGAHFWLAQFGWDSFNAALDSVEIELPNTEGWSEDRAETAACVISECRAAIESTNLGLRVK